MNSDTLTFLLTIVAVLFLLACFVGGYLCGPISDTRESDEDDVDADENDE